MTCALIPSGSCKFPGITTFDDEGLTYDNNKWHTFKAQRFNGIYANVTVDNKWRGDCTPCFLPLVA